MIITLTEKTYTKFIEEKRDEYKVFKYTFLGLWGEYETKDIVCNVPDYNEFETKKLHINSNDIKEIIENEYHTCVRIKRTKSEYIISVCESVDEIKKQFK